MMSFWISLGHSFISTILHESKSHRECCSKIGGNNYYSIHIKKLPRYNTFSRREDSLLSASCLKYPEDYSAKDLQQDVKGYLDVSFVGR